MRQSTLTFGVLLFIFVVYITVRGQLPAYLSLFKRKTGSGSTTTSLGGGGSFGGAGATGDFSPASSTSDASGMSDTDFNTLLTDI